MKLLLDTHVLLWWLKDDRRLRSAVRAVIADDRHDVWFSVASCWELSIKYRKGKIDEDGVTTWQEALSENFKMLTIERDHLVALAQLPRVQKHKDPFDQLLLAQAQAEGAALVTADRALAEYGVRVIGIG